jgi:long-chain acyl-CoA synthetase
MYGDLRHFGDLLSRNARKYPKEIGVVYKDKRMTWKEINDRSNQLAHAFKDLGVKRNEMVGILSRNRNEWIEIIFAIIKIGAIVVPLNYRLSSNELDNIFRDTEMKTVMVENDLKYLITNRDVSNLVLLDGRDDAATTFEKLLKKFSTNEPEELRFEDNDICFIMYTSGTTGRPKGAMYAHKNMLLHIANQSYCLYSKHEDTVLNANPLGVAGGMGFLLKGVYVGAKNVLLNFDPVEVMKTIEKEKVNFTNMLPTVLNIIINHHDFHRYNLSSLRRISYSGSSMPLTTLTKAMEVLSCEFMQAYGLTETASGGTALYPYEHIIEDPSRNKRLKSCGRETLNTRVRIVNEKGHDVTPGDEIGEIIINSFGNMIGYWNMPDLTKETLRDNYVYTGDLATIDEDMYIYIKDRKRDIIITGGFNVYSSEVESILLNHPSVLEAAVIGVPDEKWVEAIKGIVKLKKGMSVTADELIEYCKDKLSSYKKPRSIDIVDELPKTSYGKVLKKELRKRYWGDDAQ